MKVHELIDHLLTQDQDAEVEVICHQSGRGWYDQGGNVSWVPFDPAYHCEFSDYNGRKVLAIGVMND